MSTLDNYNETLTEAVGVFHDTQSLQNAIDELLLNGFDHAELSVLASENVIKTKLHGAYLSTTEFEDGPDVPRTPYLADESIGDAKGAIIGASVYFPAVIGSLLVTSSGGTLLGAVAIAMVAGSAGGAVGSVLAGLFGHRQAKILDEHLSHGGLLLWVRTHDKQHEQRALEILRRNFGDDIHLHELAASKHRLKTISVRRPFLSIGPAG